MYDDDDDSDYSALGESYTSLQYLYRIAAQTIGKIIPDTCRAITEVCCMNAYRSARNISFSHLNVCKTV